MYADNEYEFIVYPKLKHVKVGFVDIIFRRPHIHRELEIGLVLSGSANLMVNGRSYIVPKGSLFFINANEPHNVACEKREGVRIVYIQISNRFCQDYLNLFRNLEVLCTDLTGHISSQDNLALTKMIIDVCHCYLDDSDLGLLRCMKAVCELFSDLLGIVPYRRFDEAVYQARKVKTARIQRITEYINAHFCEKISLSDLAEIEKVSTTYLSHFISENLNMTFQDYINNLRLEKAVHLITNTSLRLTDIYMECGFSDIKYLNKAFIKQFNCMPKDFRAEHLADKTQRANDDENQYYASERDGRAWIESFLYNYSSLSL